MKREINQTLPYTFYNMNLSKNEDGTYTGITKCRVVVKGKSIKQQGTVTHPRLKIKWKDNVEWGVIESTDILADNVGNLNYVEVFDI